MMATDFTSTRRPECLWNRPLPWPTLSPGNIHIWYASLDSQGAGAGSLVSTLSFEELVRAHNFPTELSMRRFIACRGILRSMLTSYLNAQPTDITLEYGSHGKPYLGAKFAASRIRFNVAHSRGAAIFGFALDQDLGVDLEHVTQLQAAPEIADRFFSNPEKALMNSLAGKEKEVVFFKIWTGKEAYLKAQGTGLTLNLSEIEVPIQSNETNSLVAIRRSNGQGPSLFVSHVTPAYGLMAAIVVENDGYRISYWNW